MISGALPGRSTEMAPVASLDALESEVRTGRFKSALGHFQQNLPALRRADIKRSSTLEAELLYHTGDTARAITLATTALPLAAEDDECAARLTYVLAMTAFESGDYPSSLKLIHRCLLLAKASSNRALIAQAHLGLFRVCAESVSPTSSVVSSVRKAVANSGDVHSIVDLRLHFARAEASRHSLQEARGHLVAADRLLAAAPNPWLQGRVHLGLSVIATICGAPLEAVEHARTGRRVRHLCRDIAELTLVDG